MVWSQGRGHGDISTGPGRPRGVTELAPEFCLNYDTNLLGDSRVGLAMSLWVSWREDHLLSRCLPGWHHVAVSRVLLSAEVSRPAVSYSLGK